MDHTMDGNIEGALSRIEGKIDVLTLGQKHLEAALQTSEVRHESLVVRVALLERESYTLSGEKTGVEKMVKFVYATCTLVGVSAIAALGRYFLLGV